MTSRSRRSHRSTSLKEPAIDVYDLPDEDTSLDPTTEPGHPLARTTSVNSEKQTAAIDAIRDDQPSTFGGVVKDPSKKQQRVASFTTHTVPDVPNNAHIVAVCGITHRGDRDSPEKDGWFFSDFMLFNILFRGIGKTQNWICDEECTPQKLKKRWQHRFAPGFLHGHEAAERKVLNDQHAIDNLLSKVTPVNDQMILPEFLQTLHQECVDAERLDEPVFVLAFGHGIFYNYGIELGNKNQISRNPELEHDAILSIEKLAKATGKNVKVTLLTTACFSGGWVISPLNATVMAAAGTQSDNTSESWSASGSLGRFCGSMYATAVQKVLCDPKSSPMLTTGTTDDWRAQADEGKLRATMAKLMKDIYTCLFLNVDRLAYRHEIRFGVQDDAWEDSWTARTGVPLSGFKAKYDAMTSYPAKSETHIRVPGKTMPRGKVASPDPFQQGHDISMSIMTHYGGTSNRDVYRRVICGQARDYFASHPGRDNIAPNTAVHGQLRQILDPAQEVSDMDLSYASSALEYRCRAMMTADQQLKLADIETPTALRCALFDRDAYTSSLSPERKTRHSLIVRRLFEAQLFPDPAEASGGEWLKPASFIAAALVDGRYDNDGINMKIERLKDNLHETIQECIDDASRARPVRTAARAFFAEIGARVRSLSPRKSTAAQHPSSSIQESLASPSSNKRLSLGTPSRSRRNTITDSLKRLSLGGGPIDEWDNSEQGSSKEGDKGKGKAK